MGAIAAKMLFSLRRVELQYIGTPCRKKEQRTEVVNCNCKETGHERGSLYGKDNAGSASSSTDDEVSYGTQRT